MSKSLNNSIYLSDSASDLEEKIKRAFTDPARIRVNDPGHPEGCVVFAYHRKFSPSDVVQVEADCRAGRLGCVAHKKQTAATLNAFLEPFREKRAHYESNRRLVEDVIADGDARARAVARATMDEVREAMCLG
jgi:tryptophanyl-tRNA synthetase